MKLRTKRIETWVTIGDPEGDHARFLIEPLSPKEVVDLLEKAEKKEWERGQRFSETNLYQYKISKINKVIKDWELVEDENGTPIKCTASNREIVYLNNPDLIDQVLEKAEEIGRGIKDSQEKETKNLKTAQLGTETDR